MDVVAEYAFTKKERIDDGQGQNSLGVFHAFDQQMQTDVAVKEIAKSQFRDVNEFFREAQSMFRSDHSNVVPVMVASQTDDTICLSMPLYRNGSLARRIKSNPLGLSESIRIVRQVLAGLGAIHAGGTVHFDIKPSNVLFADDGRALIADFGQAREIGANGVTLMPDRMYAPCTPPETFTNARRGTVESDIFQAGMLLYRMLLGEPLFNEQWQSTGDDVKDKIIAGTFPNRNEFLPSIPDRLRRFVRQAMHPDPSKRFRSASEFSNALTRVRYANDWIPQFTPDGISWRSDRKDRPSLLVEVKTAGSLSSVTAHRIVQGKTQRWASPQWRDNMKRKEAANHITQLFEALE